MIAIIESLFDFKKIEKEKPNGGKGKGGAESNQGKEEKSKRSKTSEGTSKE